MKLGPEMAGASAQQAEALTHKGPAKHTRPEMPFGAQKSLSEINRPINVQDGRKTNSSSKRNLSPQAVNSVQNIMIDPATHAVIFQSLSNRTGEIISQVPSEALLRIREYVLENKKMAKDSPAEYTV